MIKKTMAIAASLLLASSSANAAFIAGWDFSEYVAAGVNFIDASGAPAEALDALYSDFDPTQGVGAESRAFGTAFINGQNGASASASVLSTVDQFGALGDTLPQNGTPAGDSPFDNLPQLFAEDPARGFPYSDVSLEATAATSIVFKSDLTTVGLLGTQYMLDLAGVMILGADAGTIQVEASADGAAYSAVTTLNLTDAAALYNVNLPGLLDGGTMAFVRLTFDQGNTAIDNLGISATTAPIPEPSTALMLLAGLLGLQRAGRVRR